MESETKQEVAQASAGAAVLWQTYEPQEVGELLVVVRLHKYVPDVVRIYTDIRSVEEDFFFWEPLMAETFQDDPDAHDSVNTASLLVENMNWHSDPDARFCYQIYRARLHGRPGGSDE